MPTQTISTAWRDGDPDECLPASQIQSSAPEEDTALLLERHEKLVKCFMSNIEAPMQEERRWPRVLHTNLERNERLTGMGTLANCPNLMMTGATMRAWSREEWKWLREERTDLNVVCPQDA
ncbi:hypothetical protein BKA70DRAFT_1419454 [Coprinopsis sp. MPI-PUGE-AT-0042]|nr:hypothetical protein BKA70DRAFT_1419454 [Coprinopsis sp. MPI-PUGE-AT-0042]